nr:hypothetical protein [Ruminococcus flavefaciens]
MKRLTETTHTTVLFFDIMELKFITQDNIDESHINITSAEMYTEFKEYNQHMLDMQKKRWRFLRDFWALWIMNAILLFVGIMTALMLMWNGSLIYMASGTFMPCWLLVAIYLFLMIYFIGIRKLYSWKAGLLISAILVPVNLAFIALAAANAVVIYFMDKEDSSIRNEIGYPHFAQLVGSFKSFVKDGEVYGVGDGVVYGAGLQSESAEQVPEDPFAKYRIKPEDDMGMLADNDINKE